MSAVAPETTSRSRMDLLRRSEAEWERKEISLIAELAGLDAEIPELRRAQISKAPTQEPGLSVDTTLPRKIKTLIEKRRALENTRENLTAVRALIVEEREKERGGERQRLLAVAAAFDRREEAAFSKVTEAHDAFVTALENAWVVGEEREQHLRELSFDDERFRQEITDRHWSVQQPYPLSPMRAFQILVEAGTGLRDRRGGPLQAGARDLSGVRKPLVQRAERSESTL